MCREAFGNEELVLKYCPTTEKMVDTLPKPLDLNKFKAIKGIMLMAASSSEAVMRRKKKSENGGRGNSVEARC